jgi:hypothetical protein
MRILTAFIFSVIVFLSCSKQIEEVPQQQILDESDTIRTNRAGVFLLNDLTSVDSFTIFAKDKWSLTTSPANADWFEVSADSGTGNTKVFVHSRAFNDSRDWRDGSISIATAGNPNKTKTILVRQVYSGFTAINKTYGGSLVDQFIKIETTENGGYMLLGLTRSNDGDINGSRGDWDMFGMRADATGEIIWSKAYGSSVRDQPTGMIKTSDYKFVISAQTYGNDGDVPANHIGTHPFIFQVNADGDIDWKKDLNFEASIGNGIQTKSGMLVFCGSVYHGWSNKEAIIVMLNRQGELVWKKTYPLRGYDGAYSIAETADGNFVVTGSTDGTQSLDVVLNSTADIWIFKINSSGDIIWQKTIGDALEDYGSKVVATRDGGSLILTHRQYPGWVDAATNKWGDIWILKLNSDGQQEWEKRFGTTGEESASAAVETTDGDFIIAGNTLIQDGVNSTPFGKADAYLMKLSSTGNVMWEKYFGGSRYDYTSDIVQVNVNKYVIAGITDSHDGDAIATHGEIDGWMFTLED